MPKHPTYRRGLGSGSNLLNWLQSRFLHLLLLGTGSILEIFQSSLRSSQALALLKGERPEEWVPAEEAAYQCLHGQCSEVVQVGDEENGERVDIFSIHSGVVTGVDVAKTSSELYNAKILSEESHTLSIWKNQFLDAVMQQILPAMAADTTLLRLPFWWGCLQLSRQLESVESRKLNNLFLRLAIILWQSLLTPWRLLFAFVPPCHIAHGWISFICSLIFISGIAYVVTKLTDPMSCITGISPYVISFTVLAAGTSWPDLVASKISAERQITADSAIANITCSNLVNIYVGIGVGSLTHCTTTSHTMGH